MLKHSVMREDLTIVNTRSYGPPFPAACPRDATLLAVALEDLTTDLAWLFLHDEDDGIWTIDTDITIPDTVCVYIPAGVTVVGTGVLTIHGALMAARSGWYQGSGGLVMAQNQGTQYNRLLTQGILSDTVRLGPETGSNPFRGITAIGDPDPITLPLPRVGTFFVVTGTPTIQRMTDEQGAGRVVMLRLGAGVSMATGQDVDHNIVLIGLPFTVLTGRIVHIALLGVTEPSTEDLVWLELFRTEPAPITETLRFAPGTDSEVFHGLVFSGSPLTVLILPALGNFFVVNGTGTETILKIVDNEGPGRFLFLRMGAGISIASGQDDTHNITLLGPDFTVGVGDIVHLALIGVIEAGSGDFVWLEMFRTTVTG